MGTSIGFASALAAILLAAFGSPVPAVPSPAAATPSPEATSSPTLAPLDDGSTPDGSTTPASPGMPKVLGHVYTSAYCTNFVEHFNEAARTVIGNDQHLDAVDLDLRTIESDWHRRDGAMRVYQDRVSLIGIVDKMLTSIPQSQSAVNALLAQAKATTDPERKAALQESASQLQRTVDRQRAVTDDLTSVIRVLMDKHTAEDTAESNIRSTLPPGFNLVNVSALDDPVPEPGAESMGYAQTTPDPVATPKPGSIEDVLQWTRQRWIIGHAESQAAVAADHVVRICRQEADAASPSPSATPHT